MGVMELESGMRRMLVYHKTISNDGEMKNLCERCELYVGEQHDYNECTDCQGFKFYCELKEYRFADTFK